MPEKTRGEPETDARMPVLKEVFAMRSYRAELPGRVALVPTMGALHEGHLQHIRACRENADHVIVSVFVNPTQFNDPEDFERYPRTLEQDLRRCEEAGADAVFAPDAEALYPPTGPPAEIDVPALAGILEGAVRPGHFAGVCRVVVKLLNVVQPGLVSFGRKDYQQLRIVGAVLRDLMMPVSVLEVPTVREPDGLAMSSRNARLGAEDRPRAAGLFKALNAAKQLVEQDGETDPEAVEQAMQAVMQSHQFEVGYAVVRHPQTLGELACIEPPLTGGVIALVAGTIGGVRLIDNMLLAPQSGR
jgi:pantoate--beta-alanine ligase